MDAVDLVSEISPPERCILLIDADAFFVAVARHVDPTGAGRAERLIVGGLPGTRGVVSSASYAARACGVRSGMATDRALELCPDAFVAPVAWEACKEGSRRIRSVIESVAFRVSAGSIDEFFADCSGLPGTATTAERREFADTLRNRIEVEAGYSCSIGVATVRLCAKMAAELAKPGGCHVVPAGHEALFMRGFDLLDIPGVGPALGRELRSRGLLRVADVIPLPEDLLVGWLGESRGRWLFRRVRGIDPTAVESEGEANSISCERTFDEDLRRAEDLDQRLVEIVEEAMARVRRKGYRARTVTVKLREWDFTDHSAARSFASPVEAARPVLTVAREILAQLREAHRQPVRLLGVTLSNLTRPGEVAEQIPLFEDAPLDTDRDRLIGRLRDEINRRSSGSALRGAGD